ncbi:MAG: hypothetical protein ACRDQ4_20565 [Pseudonocardiaceae bacterium]
MAHRRVFLRCLGTLLAATALTGAATASPAVAAPSSSLTQCSNTYYDGDSRLGPAQLPAPGQSEVGDEGAGYQRTGTETPEQFLARYYDSAANGAKAASSTRPLTAS